MASRGGAVGGTVWVSGTGGSLKGFEEEEISLCDREIQDGLLALLLLSLMLITESLASSYIELLEVQGEKLSGSLR